MPDVANKRKRGSTDPLLRKLQRKISGIRDRIGSWIDSHSGIVTTIVTIMTVVTALALIGWGVGSCTNSVVNSATVSSYRLIAKADMGGCHYALTLENIHTSELNDYVMSGQWNFMFSESDNEYTSAYRVNKQTSRALLFKGLKEGAEYKVKWINASGREIISIDPELPTKTPTEYRQ